MSDNIITIGNTKILVGDCIETLKTIPDNSVHCCVTSPPYWALRSYLDEDSENKSKEIGREETPSEYITNLLSVFREVRRCLRPDGICYVNIGDTYCGSGHKPSSFDPKKPENRNGQKISKNNKVDGYKAKDLMMIPAQFAIAMRNDGWWLRDDIIWQKPNCLCSPVSDRCTFSYEHIFMFTKSPKYFYDMVAIAEPLSNESIKRYQRAVDNNETFDETKHKTMSGGRPPMEILSKAPAGVVSRGTKNKRNVWRVATASYKGSHCAVMPTGIVEPCIMAGTSEYGCCALCGKPYERIVDKVSMERHELQPDDANYRPKRYEGKYENNGQRICNMKTTGWKKVCGCDGSAVVPCTVIDPFGGSGTVAYTASVLGRNSILCELNDNYIPLILERIGKVPPRVF